MYSSLYPNVSEQTGATIFSEQLYLSSSLLCLISWTIFKLRPREPQKGNFGKCEQEEYKDKERRYTMREFK